MLGLLFLFGLLAALTTKNIPTVKLSRESYITPPEIKHFTFGYKEQIADLIWLRAIQDFDFCSHPVNDRDCKGKSWLFRTLNSVVDLSPKFRIVYATGSLALTIIINDYEGASILFDKGVEQFPKDWSIIFRAAYHALYEERNKPKAARLLKQAADNGAPKWTYALAESLHLQSGESALAEQLLLELEHNGEDKAVLDSMRAKIEKYKKYGKVDSHDIYAVPAENKPENKPETQPKAQPKTQ